MNMTHQQLYTMEKSIDLEPFSRRIKVYQPSHEKVTKNTVNALKQLAKEKDCDKLIFYVLKEDQYTLANDEDYHQEGMIEGFFQGEDAYIYAMFLEPTRNQPIAREQEQSVMNIVKQDNKKIKETVLPEGYKMRSAIKTDALKMADLYNTVFKTYPTPMNDPQYIVDIMSNDVYFTIVEHHGQIISASSADLLPEFNSAEMSDCATLPEHRNKRLLTHQFSHLMNLMKQKGVQTLFCYARSVSVSMNLINARHGFTYGGRMVQNSNISGRLECMNIWFKNLNF